MTSKDFIEVLKIAHDVPNCYNNKYPKNLGYFDGKRYSFDCWNLIKVVLAGWAPTGIGGSFTKPTVTGDVDGATLLSRCTQRSKDFSKLSVPGTYLYLSTSPHAGIFIGEFTKDGKVYNVVECTRGMYAGQDGVTYSYVDKSGVRMPWKGGTSKGKWTDYGLLTPYVSYGDIPVPEPQPTPSTGKPVLVKGSKGSEVRYLQECLNKFGYKLDTDGEFGPKTEKAVKSFQKSKGLDPDGVVGPLTWAALESAPVENEPVYYTVKDGDTLGAIAKKFGTTQSKILELNPDIKNPNLIYKGQKIRIA